MLNGKSRWAIAGVAALVVMVVAFTALRHWMAQEPEVKGGPPGARLISAEQYANAIHDIFGEDIRIGVTFAPLPRRLGLLSLGAAEMMATPGLIEQFDRAARVIAAQVVDERRRTSLVPCTPTVASEPDDACATKFFVDIGRLIYRRPLSETEVELYVGLARVATTTFSDFHAGLADSLAGMLVSPTFLYFIDRVEPDPENQGRYRLDAWSKATRMSLFLWNSVPDSTLLAAAATGELHQRAGRERQVERLLVVPGRMERGARAFLADLLLLDKFDVLTKDPLIYPTFTPLVAAAAREQILRVVTDHLLVRKADYRDLFTTPHSFVNGVIAPLQRLPAEGPGWIPVTLDGLQSAGILTSIGFLSAHSHPGRSSPTLRGKAIRESLLCQKVPDPPANVNFDLFEGSLETMKTSRERLAAHSKDAVCAGCHKITDPMGLALDNYDGAGLFRAAEKGVAIDATGELDGQSFRNPVEFGRAMRAQPALASCLVSRMYSYAVGRPTAAGDRPWLAYAVKRFAEDRYRYPDLLRDIAMSRAFYAVAAPGGNGI